MPKYSSVQAYTDTNANLQTVSYERATGGKGGGGGDGGEKSRSGVVKPETVVNPYGSTAGAHSGEFHVYRKTRNREMQRMQAFHEADAERCKDEEFHNKLLQDAEQLERKTSKKRAKRQKSKQAKVRRKNLAQAGIDISTTANTTTASFEQQNDGYDDKEKDDEDEFPMIPLPAPALALAPTGETAEDQTTTSKVASEVAAVTTTPAAAAASTAAQLPSLPPEQFANDGSFLEMARKKVAATESTTTTMTKTPD